LLRSGLVNESQGLADPNGESGDCAFDLGTLYLNQYDLISALDAYKLALKIFQSNDGRQSEVRASLYAIGQIYRMQDQYPEAVQVFQELANLAQIANDQTREIDAYIGLAVIHYALNEQAAFRDSLKYVQSVPNMTEQKARNRVIPEIARYELASKLAKNESMIFIYRVVEDDIDGDGILEAVVAGGTINDPVSQYHLEREGVFCLIGTMMNFNIMFLLMSGRIPESISKGY